MIVNERLLQGPPDPNLPTVASDLEGTISAGQTWHGIRDYLLAHGRAEAYRRFQRQQLWPLLKYRLGLTRDLSAFKEKWLLDLLRLLAGLTESQMEEVGEFVVAHELWPQRRPMVVEELQAHQRAGRRVLVVSGIMEPFLAALLRQLGGLEGIGTPLRFEQAVFTGEVVGGLNVGNNKVRQLAAFAGDGRIFAAYGDTKRDIPMLAMSTRPVAVCPDDELRQEALARGWRILTE